MSNKSSYDNAIPNEIVLFSSGIEKATLHRSWSNHKASAFIRFSALSAFLIQKYFPALKRIKIY